MHIQWTFIRTSPISRRHAEPSQQWSIYSTCNVTKNCWSNKPRLFELPYSLSCSINQLNSEVPWIHVGEQKKSERMNWQKRGPPILFLSLSRVPACLIYRSYIFLMSDYSMLYIYIYNYIHIHIFNTREYIRLHVFDTSQSNLGRI